MNEQPILEPCLARLGTMPEDKPSFVQEVHSVTDINILRRRLIEKERERQSIANDLDVAARLGLVISETNEALQIKIAHLERENHLLQQEFGQPTSHSTSSSSSTSFPPSNSSSTLHHTHENNNHYADLNQHHYESAEDERIYLTQELEQARQELAKFRKEMDGLSAQLNDMASEMVDSRARVSMYAKRLAEVEHKLATTREMNTNLQMLLEKALTTQKQTSSNTTHLVKNIQTDLSRVVIENDQLRARIADLENQQIESENRLAAMVAQAKKYAALLEQAQDTIHSLSEPRLSDDDTLSNGMSAASVSSYWEGGKETEITKAKFRQEMQKEIERNLNLRNEIRHRIVTHETISSDKKKTQEGLKYLLADRGESNSTHIVGGGGGGGSGGGLGGLGGAGLGSGGAGGLAGLSASVSSSTHTSSTVVSPSPVAGRAASISGEEPTENNTYANTQHHPQQQLHASQAQTPQAPPTMNTLRPANFLTGFGGYELGSSNFITRGMSGTPRSFSSFRPEGEQPSISTRFFQRIATRFEQK
ncbi:hypothetical protein BCR43DRAFT_503985 [Syncephalastrum racemosum]|uniref:Uncharacterized protein n=1 Tax=Syncephalastrum racemosum TaxID=13706 RepID=A0A1X2HJT8_SYNRA|nr:hypothetical protein BCR43DRAFT_503985 [Syncephalastrum racemosum]